jgi:hypothetical protein
MTKGLGEGHLYRRMAFDPQNDRRWRALGVVLLLAGIAVTVGFYRMLPENPLVYIFVYAVPATLMCAGGILAFSGVAERTFG